MKKLFLIFNIFILFSSFLSAKDAGRKYTKATINGEQCKIYTDDKCEKDRFEMARAQIEYNGIFYYAYPMILQQYASEAEANYYRNRGSWSKVEFADRVEFFYITKSGNVAKEVFDKTFYTSVVLEASVKLIGNIGERIGRVGQMYTQSSIVPLN